MRSHYLGRGSLPLYEVEGTCPAQESRTSCSKSTLGWSLASWTTAQDPGLHAFSNVETLNRVVRDPRLYREVHAFALW